MLTRKTQYAWMSLGGLICLFGLVLACKLRDGNKAIAQPEQLELPPLLSIKDEKELTAPPPAMVTKPAASPTMPLPAIMTKEPELLPPPASAKLLEPTKAAASEPKPTLNMPLSSEPPPLPMPPSMAKPPVPASPTPVLPVSFDASTAVPPTLKTPEPGVLPPLVDNSSKSPPSTVIGVDKPMNPSVLPASTLPKATPPAENPKTTEKKSETPLPPAWNAPVTGKGEATTSTEHETARTQPGEPPLAPAPGPVQIYYVHHRETLQDIARRTLGSSERWGDLHKLNPTLQPDTLLASGTAVRLPADACVQADDAEPVKPLPSLRPKPIAPKAKVLPLTGTYQCSLDEKGQLTLPRALRDQLNSTETVLLSPGPDRCLWLTNQAHLERLAERLDQSQAHEADVRVFKRLYFAQTEKLSVNGDGRVIVPERLKDFAGLHQEVVLVGIDDHFEVWDAARWRSYTQQKSAGRYATSVESE